MVVAENYRNAQEQMQRENRLRELEESQQKGFYVMNPIKTIISNFKFAIKQKS